MELIKPIIRVGNSAGVILPKEWLNGEAKIRLISKPKNIEKFVLQKFSSKENKIAVKESVKAMEEVINVSV